MEDTKIVLITPPPINGTILGNTDGSTAENIEETNAYRREDPRFKTYMSKKRYAEGIMQIAEEYAETGRVVGLNFWKDIVDAMLKEEEEDYNEEMPRGTRWWSKSDADSSTPTHVLTCNRIAVLSTSGHS